MYYFLTSNFSKLELLTRAALMDKRPAYSQDPTLRRNSGFVSCSSITILNILIIFGQWVHIVTGPVNYIAGSVLGMLLWG